MNAKDTLVALYLDCVNNFLTVGRFAEYYGLTFNEANQVIELGREINERLAKDKK